MFKKNEKLTDKVFMQMIAFSFIGMLICLASLCSVTWAWFSDGAQSSSNTIKANSNFSLNVAVENGDETVLTLSGIGETTETLEAGTYSVILTLPEGSSSGYLIIECEAGEYLSPALVHHDGPEDKTVLFYLTLADQTEITFRTGWGIRSDEPSVNEGGTLVLGSIAEVD